MRHRYVKRLLVALAILLALPGLLLLVLFTAPALLLQPLGNALLAEQGIRLLRLDTLQLGTRRTTVGSMALDVPGLRVEIDKLTLDYRSGELLDGRLRAVSADEIRLTPREIDTAPDAAPGQSAEALLALLTDLPMERAAVSRINYGPLRLRASLSLETAPLRVNSQLRPDYDREWRVDLSLRAATANSLIGSSILLHESDEIFGADFNATVQDDSLALEVESGVDVTLLAALPDVTAILGDVVPLTESLHLSSQLRLAGLSTAPRIENLSGALDSPDSLLHWQLDADGNRYGQLHLPLQVELETGADFGNLVARVDDARLRLRHRASPLEFEAEAGLSDLRLQCSRPPTCSGVLQFSVLAEQWRSTALEGGATRLAGRLEFASGADGLVLRAPDLDLTLADMDYGAGVATVAFSLDGLEAEIAEGLSLRVQPVATTLVPGIAGLSLSEPALRGSLSLSDSRLSGELTLGLGERLRADATLAHALDTGTGSLDLSLQPIRFSDDAPSSQLLTYTGAPVDLVAGTLAGEAALHWQSGERGLLAEGPLTLRLDQLSGIVGDSFFVGLSSELRARLDGGRLYTENPLPATLATVDVGLPLNRIDWRFAFDSAGLTLTISDLETRALGGRVEVPHFVYDASRERNRLELVLSELDMSDIVALANYPNLRVDGRISGYLPVLLTPEGVLIEQGLVSALNPGGSIRYSPDNPDSANPSVQLLNDALSNYQYQVLDAQVQYGRDGDLEMAVALRGINPDMNGGQPINLNVNITDNIPSLLQSLQAGRVISERLEQRLNRQ